MRTLLISEIFPPQTGGTARWFWEVYRRMPRETVWIVAGEDHRQSDFDRQHNLNVSRMRLTFRSWGILDYTSLFGYSSAIRRTYRVVRRNKVQIIHCARCLPEGLIALAIKVWSRIPYICFVHGEEIQYSIASRELRWLMNRVIRGARFVIANSRNTRKLLMDAWGLSPAQIRLMHPGVDATFFVPAERNVAVRNKLGWGTRPVILTAGRLQKRKGQDMMIRALSLLKNKLPDLQYAIVGDGEERQYLEKLANECQVAERVQFLGELDDAKLLQCYQQCDLFVLPNRQVGQDIEGFGIVLVEAQACGKPVLAGQSGGTADTMRVPETGRIVPCEEPEPLANAIADMLADPHRLREMGCAAITWARDNFDWSVLSRQAQMILKNGSSTNPN